MIIADHINFSGLNPLIGVDDDQYGPRFPSLTYAYSVDLRKKMKKVALEAGIDIHEGIYLMVLGPNFETPAEIRTFHTIGADTVGMSTVPEVICAVRCGMKVLGLSVITNYGAGMVQNDTSHTETLEQGEKACTQLSYLIQKYLED